MRRRVRDETEQLPETEERLRRTVVRQRTTIVLRTAVAVVMVSYRDRACLGVTLDRAAVPEPEHFMSCLHTGFEEVLRLAAAGTDRADA